MAKVVDLRAILNTVPYVRDGAEPYGTRPVDGITGITMHYTASHPSTSIWATALYQTSDAVLAVGQPRFPSIAYHWYIVGDVAYRCHDLATRCWHSAGIVNGVKRNDSHVAICYAGGRRPSEEQIQAIRLAIETTQQELGRALEEEGHKDATQTSCPGAAWPAWRSQIVVVYRPPQGEDAVNEAQYEAIVEAAARVGVIVNGLRAMSLTMTHDAFKQLGSVIIDVNPVKAMSIIERVQEEAVTAEKKRLGMA